VLDEYESDPYNDPYAEDPYNYDSGYGAPKGPHMTPAKQLNSLDDIEKFIVEDESLPAVIGYFDKSTNEKDFNTFQELARKDGDTYRYAYTVDKSILESKKYDGCVVIVHLAKKYVNEKYERSKVRYPSKNIPKASQLKTFIVEKSIPLVGESTFASKESYDRQSLPVLTVFAHIDSQKNPKGITYIVNRLIKLAKDMKGKVIFNYANVDEFSSMMERKYGFENVDSLSKSNSNYFVVGLKHGNIYYKMKDKFSADSVKNFVEEYRAGKLVGIEVVRDASLLTLYFYYYYYFFHRKMMKSLLRLKMNQRKMIQSLLWLNLPMKTLWKFLRKRLQMHWWSSMRRGVVSATRTH
jgi:hypothetical protein